MECTIEVNFHRCASSSFAESSLSSTEVHSTSLLCFFLLSALKECLFKILDGLWVNPTYAWIFVHLLMKLYTL